MATPLPLGRPGRQPTGTMHALPRTMTTVAKEEGFMSPRLGSLAPAPGTTPPSIFLKKVKKN
jgi:hypothetical protein